MISAARKAIWDQMLPTELAFVTSNWALRSGSDSVKQYMKIIAHQDHLFGAAVKCMYKAIGVADPPTEADILAKYAAYTGDKAALFEYLHDVEELVNFRRADRPTSALARTKIQQIEQEDLLELLLNPARAENTFMKELATACIMQKSDPSILAKASESPLLKFMRYSKYLTTAEANSLLQTGAHLRDGFHVAHTINAFEAALGINKTDKAGTFWDKFVVGCIAPTGADGSFFPRDTRNTPYSNFAARVYANYAGVASVADLLTAVLSSIPLKDPADSTTLAGYITASSNPTFRFPDASELDKAVIDGLTLKQILASIDLAQFQFMVHLCKTIELNEAAVAAAVATEGGGGGGAAAGSSRL